MVYKRNLRQQLKINFLKSALNSKNNGPEVCYLRLFGHWNCLLLSVAANFNDGHGLKLEKAGPKHHELFQVFMLCYRNHPKNNTCSEFTQQDGRKKRTAKCLCVTNVTGL